MVDTSKRQEPAVGEDRSGREGVPISPALAIIGIILVALSLRPSIISMGPVLPAIIEEFGLSHARASLLTAIPDVLMGLLAVPASLLAGRYGRNPVLVGALVLLGLSTAARTFASGTALLLLATVGVGAGIAIAGALMGGFIKARFPDKAALVMGVYGASLSLGSTIAAAATGPVALYGGWRVGAGMWSGICVIAVATWLLVVRAEKKGGLSFVQPLATRAPRLPWSNPTAWLIAGYFACTNFLFYAVVAWLVPVYHDAGWSSSRAGWLLAAFMGVFTTANPIFGWLSRSEDRRLWLGVSAALCLAGLIPMAWAPELAPFLFVPLCAFGLGGAFALAMTLPLDNTDSVAEANAWNAFSLLIGYIIAALGPLAVGLLRDWTGNFGASLWMLAGVAAIMLMFSPVLGPHSPTGPANA